MACLVFSKSFLRSVTSHTDIQAFMNAAVLWVHLPEFLTLTPNFLVEFNDIDVMTASSFATAQNEPLSLI